MRAPVPSHLNSTLSLLDRAYPSGFIAEADYWAVLEILYPHMSNRNLAEAIAAFLERDIAPVTNDIYAVGLGRPTAADVVALARERLTRVGLEHWTQEE